MVDGARWALDGIVAGSTTVLDVLANDREPDGDLLGVILGEVDDGLAVRALPDRSVGRHLGRSGGLGDIAVHLFRHRRIVGIGGNEGHGRGSVWLSGH